ncbi:hypothetical protein RN001_014120 [Aquatica leii]|uniref:Cytidine deaminase n=1 Tax=Aquatica leii TaxID=1421715 RepID=A0AAN7Q0H0_9COLE|nr:hypothetical protein RN001_014120 [Aquatica leii]
MNPLLSHHFHLEKVPLESLDSVSQQSLQQAVKTRENAYNAYSKFKVGASVVTEDDLIFTGCNVENCTYTAICAERTAYVKAISEGHRKFKSVAVVAFQENNLTAPCGTCRQFMAEFGDVIVYIAKPTLEEVFVCRLNDLLPLRFHLD